MSRTSIGNKQFARIMHNVADEIREFMPRRVSSENMQRLSATAVKLAVNLGEEVSRTVIYTGAQFNASRVIVDGLEEQLAVENLERVAGLLGSEKVVDFYKSNKQKGELDAGLRAILHVAKNADKKAVDRMADFADRYIASGARGLESFLAMQMLHMANSRDYVRFIELADNENFYDFAKKIKRSYQYDSVLKYLGQIAWFIANSKNDKRVYKSVIQRADSLSGRRLGEEMNALSYIGQDRKSAADVRKAIKILSGLGDMEAYNASHQSNSSSIEVLSDYAKRCLKNR
jgi:hypothetical protein